MIKPKYHKFTIPEKYLYVPVSEKQADFIFNFLIKHNINKTLEVGFGLGVSATYIVSATSRKHIAIDFTNEFSDIGNENISKFGVKNLIQIIKKLSSIALPELYIQGHTYNFSFIDGGHKFDEIFIDFYYIDLLLEDGGYIIFDDIWMDSTKHVLSWIKTNIKNYKLISLKDSLAVLQKNGKYERDWDHFEHFALEKDDLHIK